MTGMALTCDAPASACPAATACRPEVEVTLLASFEFTLDGRPVELSQVCQRVLAFLALAERPVTRQFIAFNLWADKSEDRAYGNLRSALWRLRRLDLGLVESSGGRLAIGDDVSIDVRIAARAAAELLAGRPGGPPGTLQHLLTRDLLVDWYDPWLTAERERFRQLRLRALEALSLDLLERGDITGALDTGLAAVAAEPMRESAHRAVIRTHLAEGNLAEALRQYETYRSSAFTELGILPSRLMEDLVSPIQVIGARAR